MFRLKGHVDRKHFFPADLHVQMSLALLSERLDKALKLPGCKAALLQLVPLLPL